MSMRYLFTVVSAVLFFRDVFITEHCGLTPPSRFTFHPKAPIPGRADCRLPTLKKTDGPLASVAHAAENY